LRGILKKVGVAGLVLVAIAAIAFYVYYDRYLRYFESTNDATIQADQVPISSKLAGYVKSVPVSDNQMVAQGGLLAEIDPVDYQTKLSAAEANADSALAAVNATRANRAEAQAGIAAAQAQVRSAQANLAFALREVVRYRPLVASGAEPASALSQLEANRDRAAAEVASAQAALTQALRRVESISAQGSQLAAQAQAAGVQRQSAANDLNSTRLAAPISGRVASKSVRVGQYVQPGTRLMTLVPAQDLYVVANFKETQVGLMRPGQPATIRVDALPDVEFTGQVVSVTPGTGANFSLIPPQNATGNFTKIVQRVPVRIRIDAGPAAKKVLVPGLSLEVEVDTRAARSEIDAIRAEQERGGK
jgi:membrane fusion protein (multidrug efflux system)